MTHEVLVRADDTPRLPQTDYGQCTHPTMWRNGRRDGRQQYICASCGKQFRHNQRNLAQMRARVGRDLLRGLSIRAVARRCGVHRETVRRVRRLIETRQVLATDKGGRPRVAHLRKRGTLWTYGKG
jgi:transposase-like protein